MNCVNVILLVTSCSVKKMCVQARIEVEIFRIEIESQSSNHRFKDPESHLTVSRGQHV